MCCNSSVILIKLCTFVASNCSNWIIIHGTENVKFPAESISAETGGVGKVKCKLVQALRLCTGRTAHRGLEV